MAENLISQTCQFFQVKFVTSHLFADTNCATETLTECDVSPDRTDIQVQMCLQISKHFKHGLTRPRAETVNTMPHDRDRSNAWSKCAPKHQKFKRPEFIH